MSELIDISSAYRVRAKSEDDKFYVETIHNDDAALDKNKKIVASGMLDKSQLGLHDGADIRFVISCPDVLQWNIFKKKYPDVWQSIRSIDESIRMKGCRQLQILHPPWVVQVRL